MFDIFDIWEVPPHRSQEQEWAARLLAVAQEVAKPGRAVVPSN
jgi:hypothetical protein